jgi:hypothetical protein
MDIRKKLEYYANEYKAAMKHAEEIRNEYLKLAAKQAVIDAFNDLDEDEQMVITLGLLTGAIKESDLFDIEELMLAKLVAEQDMAEDNNEIFTIHLIIE